MFRLASNLAAVVLTFSEDLETFLKDHVSLTISSFFAGVILNLIVAAVLAYYHFFGGGKRAKCVLQLGNVSLNTQWNGTGSPPPSVVPFSFPSVRQLLSTLKCT